MAFEGVRHFCGCALKVEYFSKIPFPRPRLRFLAHLKSMSQRPFSMTMFLSTDERQLKYFFLVFSTISHEPSKTQDRTIWQMKHLNLTNMKVFCHFCLKSSEKAQIKHGKRSNIYGGPCMCHQLGNSAYSLKMLFFHSNRVTEELYYIFVSYGCANQTDHSLDCHV